MRNPINLPLWALALTLGQLAVAPVLLAEELPPGSVIITKGEPVKASSYDKEAKDASGSLTGIEVLCTKGPTKVDKKTADLLAATDKSPTAAKKGSAWQLTRAGYVQLLGGTVSLQPKPKSPRHCVISGLSPDALAKAWGVCQAGGC
jgi:hypothetical protein